MMMSPVKRDSDGSLCVKWPAFVTVVLAIIAAGSGLFAWTIQLHERQPHNGAIRSIEFELYRKNIGDRLTKVDHSVNQLNQSVIKIDKTLERLNVTIEHMNRR